MKARWLITGAGGQLGGWLVRLLRDRPRIELHATTLRHDPPPGARLHRLDLCDQPALTSCLHALRPSRIIHAAALTSVADCHADPQRAQAANVGATEIIAHAAEQFGARLVFTSTDMVFAGDAAPYRESDRAAPRSVYGRSKAQAEQAVSARRGALVVRLPLLCGFPVTARATTFVQQIAALRAAAPLQLFHDEYRTPVAVQDAAAALIALAESDARGVVHVGGPQRLSRLELVLAAAETLGLPTATIDAVARASVPAPEPRPADLSLDSSLFLGKFERWAPREIRAALLDPV